MKYHRGERFGLSEKQQSLIYWQCVNYDALPFAMQHKIINLCNEIGGIYNGVLFRAVTTTDSVTDIAYQTYAGCTPINDSNLARLVRHFLHDVGISSVEHPLQRAIMWLSEEQ